ncbi:hypothetical protein M514_06986 [Trichuris suis]|uniref:Uncharacterized protein n=1 Tax=Trichuris suis TaxID=68888 RepID=A0A085N6S1_9BILA|nr:hypothetical protein M513_06986 [Trichuris suis]KFD65167.1 hypothetical protein M514_06986 [Trichuris suis]
MAAHRYEPDAIDLPTPLKSIPLFEGMNFKSVGQSPKQHSAYKAVKSKFSSTGEYYDCLFARTESVR